MFRFLSIMPLKGWPRLLTNQAVSHLRQHRREESQQRHNAVGRFDRQRDISPSLGLLQTHLSRMPNTVCHVIVGLLTEHDDYSIAVNLIDNSDERQFTFLNLRTEFSSEDLESSSQIRMHLKHIAMMFADGNFNAPMLIHDQTPEGVPVMQELKGEIKYDFEEIDRGAAVRISTKNPAALKAIHDFLRFQIKEHKTGDSVVIGKRSGA